MCTGIAAYLLYTSPFVERVTSGERLKVSHEVAVLKMVAEDVSDDSDECGNPDSRRQALYLLVRNVTTGCMDCTLLHSGCVRERD